MLIIPAIDLEDGQVVRLTKGDYDQKTVYSNKPQEVAQNFEQIGAKYLHVVDLDGAKEGQRVNVNVIKQIKESITIPVQVGGGIRNKETVSLYLEEFGIDRVILGTAALRDPKFLGAMIRKYGPEKVVVGMDIKGNFISTNGWLETSEVTYTTFIRFLEDIGVNYIIVTDISKDGMLEGPNFALYQKIKEISKINFVVSGGIKDDQDIYDLAKLDYYGCIVGKAFYDNKVNLEEVLSCV